MNKLAFIIYLIVLILSPLLFGAVHTYVYSLMSLGILTGTCLLIIHNIKKDHKTGLYQLRFPGTSLNFGFFIMLIFLIFQIIPLPESFVRLLSPEAVNIAEKVLPPSEIINAENQGLGLVRLAPYYYPVRMSIIRFTIYSLFFIGLVCMMNSQKRIETVIFIILIIGSFESIYGIAQTYSNSGYILWFKKSVYGSQKFVTGTYINRNHFAGLMEIILFLAATYSLALAKRKIRKSVSFIKRSSLRTIISGYLSDESQFSKRILIFVAAIVTGIGLAFSTSRGGLLGASGAMLCISMFFIFKKVHRRKGIILLCLFFITSAYAIHIGVEQTVERFKYININEGFELRNRFTKKTINMFNDYKLTGIGLGNFQYVYPKYQAAQDKWFIRFAHNDWAQFIAEAGIIGFCIFFAGISYYFYRLIKLLRRRNDPFAVCLGIAPIAAIVSIAIHSYTDFNLHIPANYLMLMAVMAIGYSALHLERHHSSDRSFYHYHKIELNYKGWFILILFAGFMLWNSMWTIRHFIAEACCNTVPNSTLNREKDPSLQKIKAAVFWDSSNAEYHYKLANKLMRIRNKALGELDDIKWRETLIDIIKSLEKATQLNPFNPEYHLRLGWHYTYLWKEPDYHQKWLPAADIAMKRTAFFAGDKIPNQYVELGNYWTMRSKNNIIESEKPLAWKKACIYYKKAQNLVKGRKLKKMKDKILKYIEIFYKDEKKFDNIFS
ncbi:O-antigen polymerase [Candidatus Magnetomoraceae bacterium gMMP-1]